MTTPRAADQLKQCGAKTRSGAPCKTAAMPNGRCRMHGGKAPSGIASGTFKHGRHSKYMPGRLLARYEESLTDPDLLELMAEIALVDVRLTDLLRKVDTGDTRTAWQIAGDLISDLDDAVEAKKTDAVKTILTGLKAIFLKGFGESEIWQQILEAAEARRKLVESEQKRQTLNRQMISAERVMLIIAALQDSVRKHVTDPDIRAAISADITRLIAQPVS